MKARILSPSLKLRADHVRVQLPHGVEHDPSQGNAADRIVPGESFATTTRPPALFSAWWFCAASMAFVEGKSYRKACTDFSTQQPAKLPRVPSDTAALGPVLTVHCS